MRHYNVKSERVRVGMTQGELAEKLRVSSKTMVAYEADPKCIPASTLVEIADLFGCSTEYLLDRTDRRNN